MHSQRSRPVEVEESLSKDEEKATCQLRRLSYRCVDLRARISAYQPAQIVPLLMRTYSLHTNYHNYAFGCTLPSALISHIVGRIIFVLFWFLPYRVCRRMLLRHTKDQPLIQTWLDDQTNVFSLRFPLLLDDNSGASPPTPHRTPLRVPVVALRPSHPALCYSNISNYFRYDAKGTSSRILNYIFQLPTPRLLFPVIYFFPPISDSGLYCISLRWTVLHHSPQCSEII